MYTGRYKMKLVYYFDDHQVYPFEYEIDGREYLRSLSKDDLIDLLNCPYRDEVKEELELMTVEELIDNRSYDTLRLIDDGSLWEYYYDEAQREYRQGGR